MKLLEHEVTTKLPHPAYGMATTNSGLYVAVEGHGFGIQNYGTLMGKNVYLVSGRQDEEIELLRVGNRVMGILEQEVAVFEDGQFVKKEGVFITSPDVESTQTIHRPASNGDRLLLQLGTAYSVFLDEDLTLQDSHVGEIWGVKGLDNLDWGEMYVAEGNEVKSYIGSEIAHSFSLDQLLEAVRTSPLQDIEHCLDPETPFMTDGTNLYALVYRQKVSELWQVNPLGNVKFMNYLIARDNNDLMPETTNGGILLLATGQRISLYGGGRKLGTHRTHSEITAMRVDGNVLFTTSKDLGLRAYQI